jgi:hypothetical protein
MYLTMWDIIFHLNNLGILYNLHFEIAQSFYMSTIQKRNHMRCSKNENTNCVI